LVRAAAASCGPPKSLYAHSWGTIPAVEYYRAHPDRVANLVLASPALDIPAWESNARQLLATLSDSMQRAVRLREAEQRYDAPDYQAALGEFYSRYVWRTPVQADLDSLMATANQGIYMYMQGPSEFTSVLVVLRRKPTISRWLWPGVRSSERTRLSSTPSPNRARNETR
jgi:pimeloyl-ACP methyl ester carboxylesterase